MLLIKMLLRGAAVSVRMRFVPLVVQLFLQIEIAMTPNLLLRCPGGKEGVQHCSIERSSYDFSVNDVIPLLLRCSLQEVESALSAADLRGSCTHSRILSVPTLSSIILP